MRESWLSRLANLAVEQGGPQPIGSAYRPRAGGLLNPRSVLSFAVRRRKRTPLTWQFVELLRARARPGEDPRIAPRGPWSDPLQLLVVRDGWAYMRTGAVGRGLPFQPFMGPPPRGPSRHRTFTSADRQSRHSCWSLFGREHLCPHSGSTAGVDIHTPSDRRLVDDLQPAPTGVSLGRPAHPRNGRRTTVDHIDPGQFVSELPDIHCDEPARQARDGMNDRISDELADHQLNVVYVPVSRSGQNQPDAMPSR
jgi:hypothetical protein